MEYHAYARFRNARYCLRHNETILGLDTWQLFLNGSFGDTYVAFSLLNAFCKYHPGTIRVLYRDIYQPLTEIFPVPGINFIPLERPQFGSIEQILRETVELIDFRPGRIYPTQVEMHANLPKLFFDGRMRYMEVLRAIMQLPVGEPMVPPMLTDGMLAEAAEVLRAAGGIPGQSIILNPANTAHTEFSPQVWAQIAERLAGAGRPVFTNVSPQPFRTEGSQPELIPHTRPIELPPHLAVAILDLAGTFISGLNSLLTIAALFCRSALRIQLENLQTGEACLTKRGQPLPRRLCSLSAQYGPEMLNPVRFQEVPLRGESDTAGLQEIVRLATYQP